MTLVPRAGPLFSYPTAIQRVRVGVRFAQAPGMCRWYELIDTRPGPAPETRFLDDRVLVVFYVGWGPEKGMRGRLVLRCDANGTIYAALQRDRSE